MSILARGYRTEPIADGWRQGMVSRGYRVWWAGHVQSISPPPPVPPRPRPSGGGGGGFPFFPVFPQEPEIVSPPCEDLQDIECDVQEQDVTRDTALGLAEALSAAQHKSVAFGLAAVFCRPKSKT